MRRLERYMSELAPLLESFDRRGLWALARRKGVSLLPHDTVAFEVTMHKLRVACPLVQPALRTESRAWLVGRGYRPWAEMERTNRSGSETTLIEDCTA